MNPAPAMPLNCFELGSFVWTNVDCPTAGVLNDISARYRFHPLDVEDCLLKTQLPKIDEYRDYLFIILHFPRFQKDKNYSVPEQVSVFIGRDFLVTVHSGALRPVNKLFEAYSQNGGCSAERSDTGDEQARKTPVFLLYRLVHGLVENLMVMLGKVLANIEPIEVKVFDEKVDAVREITEIRHDIANLRRIVFPLKRVIHELEKKVKRFEDGDMSIYFNDLVDYIDRAWVILDECKETIEIYKDTDFIISSEKTNKILTFLTIIFTFSIPPTMVGTIWGMNVRVPGSTAEPWTFLGPYTSFMGLLTGSLIPVIIMYLVFKRVKWL